MVAGLCTKHHCIVCGTGIRSQYLYIFFKGISERLCLLPSPQEWFSVDIYCGNPVYPVLSEPSL